MRRILHLFVGGRADEIMTNRFFEGCEWKMDYCRGFEGGFEGARFVLNIRESVRMQVSI